MDKATKAIRRSGVRLKSLSSGHGDIQMIVSQLGEVRTSFKAFSHAQTQASEDTLKWASSHENRAIGETFGYIAELALLWSEVQRDFAEQLKEYKSLYELILEGERHVTQARETLVSREQRETKLRKEYAKVSKKAPVEEVRLLKERLNQAERSRDLAHLELVERVGENEAVKMIRVKEGLLKLGAAYQELGQKCLIIFSAHQGVTAHLPDVHDKNLHDVKYTGSESARKLIAEAREQVRNYCSSVPVRKPPLPDDPPPPYTPSLEHLNDLSNSRHNGVNGNNIPSNINGSPHGHPTVNGGIRVPDNTVPSASHHRFNGVDNRPTAPSISSSTIDSPVPNSPPKHIYPELPKPTDNPQPVIPSPPKTPGSPHDQHVGHFQSVPNLGDGSFVDHGLKYPPLNIGENSSFNDSSFHPDTSSSSPSLLSSRTPKTPASPDDVDSPPFNPYYDWLPAHIANRMSTPANKPQAENTTSPESVVNENSDKGTVVKSAKSKDRSAPPSKNLNPFLEDSADEDEDLNENSGTGAVKKK